ncbi:uncharacterized protein LOC125370900 [Ricinus communis]|uniref:uncharacterized protein LOC125370900 n=1 Tax=Ricinus communis TaxID=3988 RepID=UPI00201A75BE|nr:uncharacterized protein LOC125370900 [Ricinus communis]
MRMLGHSLLPELQTQGQNHAGPWFTFDDLPPSKWKDKLSEFLAWIDLQMTLEGATLKKVLAEFVIRFTGSLRDWFQSQPEYTRLQFVTLPTLSAAVTILHNQFLGSYDLVIRQQKQEFFDRNCCSLKMKDLKKHYSAMSKLYYVIGGHDGDDTLKYTFIASLPDEIQPEVNNMIAATKRPVTSITLGEIWQFTLSSIKRLCDQQELFKRLSQRDLIVQKACNKNHLKIKCKAANCVCSNHKKKSGHHFQKYTRNNKKFREKNPKRFKYFRKKRNQGYKSDRCFVCKRKGHYAKNCLRNPEKSAKMIQQVSMSLSLPDSFEAEIESLLSKQEDLTP